MTASVSLLTRAERYLRSARLLLTDGDPESAVSRAYYGMFFAAEAALLTRGIAVSSHKGLIATFGEAFVVPGILPRHLGRDLNEAFAKRLIGDYGHTTSLKAEDAAALLRRAEAFVSEIKTFVVAEDK